MKKYVTLMFAISITLSALLIAVASGLERGGNTFDKIIFVILALTITLLAHLLPALIQCKLAYFVWACCLAVSFYGYVTFFYMAQNRIGEVRIEHSILVSGDSERLKELISSRDAIKSRNVSQIVRDLKSTTEDQLKIALNLELQQAQNKLALQNKIDSIQETIYKQRGSDQKTDLVSEIVAKNTGSSSGIISFALLLLMSALVELSGVLLWKHILSPKSIQPKSIKMEAEIKISEPFDTDINKVMQAISSGKCRKTQRAIREYLGCSNEKAQQLNKQIQTNLH